MSFSTCKLGNLGKFLNMQVGKIRKGFGHSSWENLGKFLDKLGNLGKFLEMQVGKFGNLFRHASWENLGKFLNKLGKFGKVFGKIWENC